MYCIVNRPVKMIIGSRDVIHDVGLVYFRQKMDAVPGTPTTLGSLQSHNRGDEEELSNPDFEYEISCDQMCGKVTITMRGVIKVVTNEEYRLWLAKQKPNYTMVMGTGTRRSVAAAPDSTKNHCQELSN